jgi:hypothetical protein
MCAEKGISPWSYLLGFITGFFLVLFATSAAIIFVYGSNVMSDPDAMKKIASFSPFAMMFHFLLFIFFRHKISRIPDYNDEDDETHLPPPASGNKDLSYFR